VSAIPAGQLREIMALVLASKAGVGQTEAMRS
jgi:hypothetical protein